MGFPEPMSDLLTLIVGTLTLRPYVVVFLAVYLAAASRDLGLRRALAFTPRGGGGASLGRLGLHAGRHVGDRGAAAAGGRPPAARRRSARALVARVRKGRGDSGNLGARVPRSFTIRR